MMSRHAKWRKIAKKFRRKRIRQKTAKERDLNEKRVQLERENSPSYRIWLENEEKAEELRIQEEQRIQDELEAKWLDTERMAQKEWRELQNKLEHLRKERAIQNAKIREEWEKEKQKLKEAEEAKKREIEEKIKQQQLIEEKINNFVQYGGDIPESLKVDFQTNPSKPPCPFFSKTSACRFGDSCSRNHIRPGISKIILIPNFYSHYSLGQAENEHGNSSLEFENNELYDHFMEFFHDIVPEMEKFGEVKQIVVCCNTEIHLRGNVYVEYSSERQALAGCKSMNGRWYAGRQLSVQFSNVSSWKTAICGLFHRRKCPKGGACNFIHRFLNPKSKYTGFNERFHKSPSKKEIQLRNSPRRDWRWSESPEHDNTHHSDWEERHQYEDEYSPKENGTSNRYNSERHSQRSRRDSSRSKHKRRRSRSDSKRRKKDKVIDRKNKDERRHKDNSSERRKSSH